MRHTQDKRHISMSRKQQQKRKQVIFLLVLLFLFAGFAVFMLVKGLQTKSQAADGYEDAEESSTDSILYDGKYYRYNEHLSNYLFMGIDAQNTVDAQQTQTDAGQADFILLLSYDRKEKTLRCLNIPRDTMTDIEVFSFSGQSQGKQKNHLNLQYAYGDGKYKSCELMKTAVSDFLYQLPIQGYCSLKMDAISVLTDLVDGVDVTVPDDSLESTEPTYKEGTVVHLTKDTAEQYVRYRDTSRQNSALVRQNRHQSFLQGFLTKTQTLAASDAGIVTELYEGAKPYMVTNVGTDVFADFLEASQNSSVEQQTVPGDGEQGAYHDEFQVDEDALYALVLQMFYTETENGE